jgi:hypothetical protein
MSSSWALTTIPSDRELAAREQRAREAAAAKAAIEAARKAELAAVIPRAERGDLEAMRRVADLLNDAFGFRPIEYRQQITDASAYFTWPKGPAVCLPITDEVTFAVVLHELGHGVAGRCPGREPHRPDPTVKRWFHCLECETAAWTEAMKMVTFSLPMFRRLQWSQRTYRDMTPAGPEALEALATLTSFEQTYAAPKQRRAEMQLRQELIAGWQTELSHDRQRLFENSLDGCRVRLARAMEGTR